MSLLAPMAGLAATSFPPGPDPVGFRLASPADVMRIGIVATAAFRYSPLFQWERPYHKKYPEDTLLSYRTQFKNAVQNDEFIVLVIEDEYKIDENKATEATIPAENGWDPPAEGEKVIVGVASIKLEPNSQRKGQFKSYDGEPLSLPDYLGIDLNRKHYDSWGEKVSAAKKKHCANDSSMSMLVVHPAYWRKGHGTKLVEWSMRLSDLDSVPQCVSAAGMGKKLYKKLGYHEICRVEEKGDEDGPRGVHTELLEYRPKAKLSAEL